MLRLWRSELEAPRVSASDRSCLIISSNVTYTSCHHVSISWHEKVEKTSMGHISAQVRNPSDVLSPDCNPHALEWHPRLSTIWSKIVSSPTFSRFHPNNSLLSYKNILPFLDLALFSAWPPATPASKSVILTPPHSSTLSSNFTSSMKLTLIVTIVYNPFPKHLYNVMFLL